VHLQRNIYKAAPRDIRHLHANEKIFDLYYWEEVLQEAGDGGKVVVCRPKQSQSCDVFGFVMKIRSKESLRKQCHEESFRKSMVRMLNLPPHAGVMSLEEVLEDDANYYVVMEKALGGSFFRSLLDEFRDGAMPHSAVRRVLRELLEALGHVHRNGMLHRDIKPDNLVMQLHDDPLSPRGKASKVVLIDFDHADPDFCRNRQTKSDFTFGTIGFTAPETFFGYYSISSDLYSVGVILYLLIAGQLPHDCSSFHNRVHGTPPTADRNWRTELCASLKGHPMDWSCDPWPDHSDCKDLCARLLAPEPQDRPSTAEDALSHRWLCRPSY